MQTRKNRFYFYGRLLKWRLLGDRSPVAASIKITQRCNLRCEHCAWEKKDQDERSLTEWKTTIDDLYQHGVSVIAVEGGEPSLHEQASDIVAYIRNKGIYTVFITNGTRDISHIDPDVFWISIDGMEATHDRIRGAGTFQRAVRTIRSNRDKKIMSLTSLSRSNRHDIEPLCRFLSPLLSGMIFNFTYPYSGIRERVLDNGEKQTVAQTLMALKMSYPKLINSYSYLSSVGRKKCLSPWLLTTVTSDGKGVQGCMVRHIEPQNCSLCDMGCCAELSNVYALRSDSMNFWARAVGLPRLF